MEQLGNYFLAGAMLARDENIGIRRANLTNQLKHGLHGGSASDKLGHAFSAEEAIFKFELTGATQSLMHSTAKSMLPQAVMTMTGMRGSISWMRARRSRPSWPEVVSRV